MVRRMCAMQVSICPKVHTTDETSVIYIPQLLADLAAVLFIEIPVHNLELVHPRVLLLRNTRWCLYGHGERHGLALVVDCDELALLEAVARACTVVLPVSCGACDTNV
jgi:hypothetical protein